MPHSLPYRTAHHHYCIVPYRRAQLNMKIYVDTDDDVRLARRIQRDVSHRGRDVQGVLQQYTTFVKPSFDQFVGPRCEACGAC